MSEHDEATEVYKDGRVHVRAEQCGNCLFSRDRLVPGRRAREIVTSAQAETGGSFVCHKSQVSDEPTSVCRIYYDRFAVNDPIFRLARAMDIIEFVEGTN